MGYMNDRQLGYIVLIVLLIFAAISVGTIVYAVCMPVEKRIIEFDSVKSLKIADPVRVRGVTVGRISRIRWHAGKALVTVTSGSKLPIRRDYVCTAVDIGVMGDRMIELSYGSPDRELVSPRDTLVGHFVLGPSEAIGMVEKLRATVEDFARVSRRLLAGDKDHESLVSRIGRFVAFTDSLSTEISTFARTFNRGIPAKLDTLNRLIDGAAGLIDRTASVVPGALDTLDGHLARIGHGIAEIETLLDTAAPMLEDLRGPEDVVWRDRIASLLRSLHDLRRLVQELRETGLRLKIRPSLRRGDPADNIH